MRLAIDTSTAIASIAVVRDGDVLAELTWRCGQNHTTQLLPALSELLKRLGININSLQSIVVARGPGSFNGLRVGIGTAKGLAFSLGVPIVGVGTLEAEAYQHAETGLPVCSLYRAGRGEIAAALYQKKSEQWLELAPAHLTTLDALYPEINSATLFCGELTLEIASELRQRLGERAVIPPRASLLRRAAFLAELGGKRLEAGDSDNVSTLQPLYLRRPAITEPKRRYPNAAEGR